MIEQRQSKLAANAEAIERWQRKLFRAATELKKLTEQRKRLLKAPTDKLKYRGDGGAVEGMDDSLDGI